MKVAVRRVTREGAMLPIELIPASELPVSELADTELDVVCGGFLNNLVATNIGLNIAVPVVVGVGRGGPSNVANIVQELNQANFSAGFLQGSIF
jgi:hypothetical protein